MDRNKQLSSKSLFGLNGMIFCMSDVRPGVGPFLAIFLKSYLQWSADKVGLALGAMDLTAALSQMPCGLAVDSAKSKRLLILIACLAISVGCVLILLYPRLSTVLLSQAMIGIATAILPPAIAAITLGLVGKGRFPKRISINETWGHAGNAFTAAIVGFLGYWLGLQWILYMVVVFAAASIFFLKFIRPEEINHAAARELSEEGKPIPIYQIFSKSSLLVFCFSVFLFHFSNAAQLPLIGQLLSQKNPAVSSLFMGSCIILAQVVMMAVAYVTGFFMNKAGRKPIFLLAIAALPIRALLFTLTESPFLLLAIQMLDGIGAAIFGVIAVVIISDIAKGTGRFNFSLGLMALFQGVGASSSNILAGNIAHHLGYHAAFITLAGIALGCFLFFGLFMPETKNA